MDVSEENSTLTKYELYKLSDNVEFYIGDSINIPKNNKFKMIYFDPPFNSDRDYKLNCDSKLGFSDKWSDIEYEFNDELGAWWSDVWDELFDQKKEELLDTGEYKLEKEDE